MVIIFALIVIGLCADVLAILAINLNFSRKYFACLAIISHLLVISWSSYHFVVGTHDKYILFVLATVAIYRYINSYRVLLVRGPSRKIQLSTIRSAFWLLMAQLILLTSLLIEVMISPYLITIIGLVMALLLLILTIFHRIKYQLPSIRSHLADSELPAVSVLIPARNETQELIECLESLTTVDYPKLEILVVDDCSTNPKTSEIIKSFASKGIRFIAGGAPDDNWLGKNNALQILYEQSSSPWLLYLSTDIKLNQHSIKQLMSRVIQADAEMVSVLPFRLHPSFKSLFGPFRYWWEFSLPRKLLNRPPVLSSSWLIKRSRLKKFGGFKGVSRSIIPERHLARFCGLKYRFWQAQPKSLYLANNKSLTSRYHSAHRLRYPQLKRRLERTSVVTLALLLMLMPVMVINEQPFLVGLHILLLSLGFTIASYGYYGLSSIIRGLLFLPLVIVEISIINYSMLAYEFSRVLWKGRNVCLPVMQVFPRLPKI